MIALVTGASSGIGAATARRLAREADTHVILLARRRERLEALAAELGSASVIVADLVEQDTPARVAEQVEREHGRLDLLVNNAGVGGRGSFGSNGWAGIQRTMAVNFDAPVRLTEALLPLLRRSAPSSVVNIGSGGLPPAGWSRRRRRWRRRSSRRRGATSRSAMCPVPTR